MEGRGTLSQGCGTSTRTSTVDVVNVQQFDDTAKLRSEDAGTTKASGRAEAKGLATSRFAHDLVSGILRYSTSPRNEHAPALPLALLDTGKFSAPVGYAKFSAGTYVEVEASVVSTALSQTATNGSDELAETPQTV